MHPLVHSLLLPLAIGIILLVAFLLLLLHIPQLRLRQLWLLSVATALLAPLLWWLLLTHRLALIPSLLLVVLV